MKLSFTKEEHEKFIKNHFQIKTAHVIDEENERYYILPVKEDYTKHDRVIAKTQAEKFGFVFGDGLMVLGYKPIKPTCANYERDNVETETYTITADKYFHQEFKKLVNIDAPILSEMEQNVADYVAKKDWKEEYMEEQIEKLIDDSPKHYDNSNGSLYNFCEKQKLNTWEFDIIKRVIRCRKKGQFEEDLKKTKFLIDLYLKEYDNPIYKKYNGDIEKLMQQKEDITELVASEPNDWELGKLLRKKYGK